MLMILILIGLAICYHYLVMNQPMNSLIYFWTMAALCHLVNFDMVVVNVDLMVIIFFCIVAVVRCHCVIQRCVISSPFIMAKFQEATIKINHPEYKYTQLIH